MIHFYFTFRGRIYFVFRQLTILPPPLIWRFCQYVFLINCFCSLFRSCNNNWATKKNWDFVFYGFFNFICQKYINKIDELRNYIIRPYWSKAQILLVIFPKKNWTVPTLPFTFVVDTVDAPDTGYLLEIFLQDLS